MRLRGCFDEEGVVVVGIEGGGKKTEDRSRGIWWNKNLWELVETDEVEAIIRLGFLGAGGHSNGILNLREGEVGVTQSSSSSSFFANACVVLTGVIGQNSSNTCTSIPIISLFLSLNIHYRVMCIW